MLDLKRVNKCEILLCKNGGVTILENYRIKCPFEVSGHELTVIGSAWKHDYSCRFLL